MTRRLGTSAVLALLVALLGAAAPPRPPPGIEEAARRVADLSKRVGDPSLAPAQRASALEESIKAREELLTLASEDERQATWLLDQAEALLQRAGRDGAALSVLYGIPTGEQRLRVRDAATEAARLAQRAETAAEGAVSGLEAQLFAARSDPEKTKKLSETIEPRLRVLVDTEQAWRAPMLQARSAVLAAALQNEPAATPMRRRAAAAAAEVLAGLRGPDPEGETSRLALWGTASLLAGDAEHARAHFAAALGAHTEGIGAEQARLGQALAAPDLAAALASAKQLAAEAPSLALGLLRAEAAARSVLAHLGEEPEAAGRTRAAALSVLGGVARRSLQKDADAGVRALIFEKVRLATQMTRTPAEMGALEPIIAYARALSLLREPGESPEHAEGTALLKHLLTRADAKDLREPALWALGMDPVVAAKGTKQERLDAAGDLVRLVEENPGSEHVREALERAGVLLGSVSNSDSAALALERRVIELKLGATPPLGDQGALRSAYLANVARDGSLALTPVVVTKTIGPVPTWGVGESARREADEQNAFVVVSRALRVPPGTTEEGLAITGEGVKWAARVGSARIAWYRLFHAQALLSAGRAHDAIEQIEAIGPLDKSPLPLEDQMQARLALGRAQRAAGEQEKAFATLRTLADELDHDAERGEPRRPATFWSAWAEMLEILQAQNSDGQRTATIRLQLNRLGLIDKELGAEPWKGRIEKVREGLK